MYTYYLRTKSEYSDNLNVVYRKSIIGFEFYSCRKHIWRKSYISRQDTLVEYKDRIKELLSELKEITLEEAEAYIMLEELKK